MSKSFDIRDYKKDLRSKYKAKRESMSQETKAKKDASVRRQVLSMREYKKYDLFLCYVSLAEEIDTKPLIVQAISDGKTVAVPYCIPKTRKLEFYKIDSLDSLEVRTYGVLEPIAQEENKITNFSDCLCILPGLSFDRYGYRLGYGGGYYDRFLSKDFKGITAGVCYQNTVRNHLIHGYYDVPCDYIVTEYRIQKRKKNKKRKHPHKG